MKSGIYREDGDGGKYRVEVLADEVKPAPPGWAAPEDRYRFVTLRCIEMLRRSPFVQPIPQGEEWTATRLLGAGGAYSGWSLDEDEDE